jgi:hypothetical protein
MPRIPVGISLHADVVLKQYAPDKNQAIYRMMSCQRMGQLKLNLRQLTICLPRQLDHLPILVASTYCKLMPQHEVNISKKYFRPGGMAPSEWTRSVRAVRDTPVADYSAPGVNSTRRVPYRPLIAVSPFLLVLSVSYFKRSLWRCG